MTFSQDVNLPDGSFAKVGGATREELDANVAALLAKVADADKRRQYVDDVEAAWALVRPALRDRLNDIPAPPTGAQSLALHTQQIAFLYDFIKDITRVLVGTPNVRGLGDVVVIDTRVLAALIERAANITPPD